MALPSDRSGQKPHAPETGRRYFVYCGLFLALMGVAPPTKASAPPSKRNAGVSVRLGFTEIVASPGCVALVGGLVPACLRARLGKSGAGGCGCWRSGVIGEMWKLREGRESDSSLLFTFLARANLSQMIKRINPRVVPIVPENPDRIRSHFFHRLHPQSRLIHLKWICSRCIV